MKRNLSKMFLVLVVTVALALCLGVQASVMAPTAYAADALVPYNEAHPIAFPVVENWNIPPLVTAKPKDPVYIPTLEGLVAGKPAINFMGGKIPKHDALTIKQSVVKDGKITIPPGGFVFKFDTTRGILPVAGSTEFIFGADNLYYYIDYPGAVIAKATNVTIKRGERVVVGDNIFTYMSATGHGCFRNPVVDLRYKNGGGWDFVGMAPAVFTMGLTEGDPGKDLHYGYPPGYKPGGDKEAAILDYNQLFATRKNISGKQITFDTIYSMDLQEWTMCPPPLAFKGKVKKGKKIKAKDYLVEILETGVKGDEQFVVVKLSKGGKEVAQKKLFWNAKKDRYLSPYNLNWQGNILLKHGDIIVHLLAAFYKPLKNPVDKDGANIVVYQNCFTVRDGQPARWDKRFLVDHSQCPQGHGFGTMFYNKDEIVLDARNNVFKGPKGYLNLVIDNVKGDAVKFHLETGKGAKSLVFTKKGNVDLLLGQGRAQKDIMRDLNHATEREMYRQLKMESAK
jgi:hypothetical protein